MSNTKQIIYSIAGALLAGVAIYWIDKFFDAKLAQADADAGKQPDLSSPQLPMSPQVSLQSIAPVNAGGTSTTSDGCDSCSTSDEKTNTPPPMSDAQTNIANLMSLLQNDALNYNAPTSNIPTAPTINNGSSYGVVNQSSIVNANNHGISTNPDIPPPPTPQVWTPDNGIPKMQSGVITNTYQVQ